MRYSYILNIIAYPLLVSGILLEDINSRFVLLLIASILMIIKDVLVCQSLNSQSQTTTEDEE